MDAVTNSVESLWNFLVSVIWRIWICFAVIVFVHVKCRVSPLSSHSTPEDSKTSITTNSRLSSVRKRIKTARKLLRRNRLHDADAILNEGIPLSEEVFENDSSDMHEHRVLTGCLHEIRALCLYRKGDVIGCAVEMDRGLAVVKNPGLHLLTSANQCFQLFHKWCCENVDHYQQDIVMYFQDKKKRMKTAALEKITDTSLLLESVHCLLLSDLLVKRAVLEMSESTDMKKLCKNFYCSLKSEEAGDQILSSVSSVTEPLDAQKSADEKKYTDLVQETEEVSIFELHNTVQGLESTTFK